MDDTGVGEGVDDDGSTLFHGWILRHSSIGDIRRSRKSLNKVNPSDASDRSPCMHGCDLTQLDAIEFENSIVNVLHRAIVHCRGRSTVHVKSSAKVSISALDNYSLPFMKDGPSV